MLFTRRLRESGKLSVQRRPEGGERFGDGIADALGFVVNESEEIGDLGGIGHDVSFARQVGNRYKNSEADTD
jgi:hypothetical protein